MMMKNIASKSNLALGMHVVHILFYVPMKIHESKPCAMIHEYVEKYTPMIIHGHLHTGQLCCHFSL